MIFLGKGLRGWFEDPRLQADSRRFKDAPGVGRGRSSAVASGDEGAKHPGNSLRCWILPGWALPLGYQLPTAAGIGVARGRSVCNAARPEREFFVADACEIRHRKATIVYAPLTPSRSDAASQE